MDKKILVFSGKKESGKNTCSNFVHGLIIKSLGIIKDFEVSTITNGQLFINNGNKPFDLSNWWLYIKQFAFADDLKKMCMDVFLLKHEQCYGTNQQKDSLTKYLWEKMPNCPPDKSGYMSAREIMQHVGTNVFRKIYDNIWTDACLNRIGQDTTQFAVITDCRFPNEVISSQNSGGKVIRLTRNINPDDNHDSETALDGWEKFDYILDNEKLTIEESCQELHNVLKEWKWVSQ
jgi:hypothetical protein